jgi:hypothetical protein
MKFELGAGLRCDLQVLIDTRALIQANSGGGKSHALRRLLEQTHGKVQHLVIDPEGEFASLRERFDYVLAARQGGDTAADPRGAKLLAERLLQLNVSAILDIYELKAHERIRFVRHFLEALVDAPKTLWHPALVVVDEAHVFCPQQGEAESAGAVIDLCTRGRKRGFSAILATQRLSKLHKDAAAELNNKLIGRTGLDVDRKRAGEELGFTTKEQLLSLRQLEPGHFYAFGPALSLEVRQVLVGPVQTTHPKAGSRIAFTAPPPTDKVRALLPQLADLPAEAEQKQKSLDELKRDNATLRATITRLERATPPGRVEQVRTVVEKIEVPMLSAGQVAELVDAAQTLYGTMGAIGPHIESLQGLQERVRKAVHDVDVVVARATAPAKMSTAKPVSSSLTRPAARVAAKPVVEGEFQPSKAQQRVLNALAWLESVGLGAGDKTQVALLADQSPTSSGYANNLGALRTAGLLEYPGPGTVGLTDVGRGFADAGEVPSTSEQLHDVLYRKVSRAQGAILRALIAVYPDELTKADLADQAGASATSSAYANNLGALRSLKLIDYTPARGVKALPVLFLESAQ